MPGEKHHQRSHGRSRSRSRDRRRSRSDSRDRRRRGGSDRGERRGLKTAAEEARRSDAAPSAGASSSSARRSAGSPRRHTSRGDSRDRGSHRSRTEHRAEKRTELRAPAAESHDNQADKDVSRRRTGATDHRSEQRSDQLKAEVKSHVAASDSRGTAAAFAKPAAVDAKDSESSIASRTASSRHEVPVARPTGNGEQAAAAVAAASVDEGEPADEEPQYKQAANFGLSGALAKDVGTGNLYKGVLLKWSEPADARAPTKKWRLYVFKGDQVMQTLYIHRQSAYLVGRERKIADIPVDHPSCSKQHAVIQFRQKEVVQEAEMQTVRSVRPYIMDLERYAQ
jgi:smad nuclear-interacting protein 1